MSITGWRTSSRCEGGACVGAGNWRSACAGNGSCVEACSCRCGVGVRDSTDRSGPVLTFGAGTWTRFLAGLKADG